jgi:hypothetical protein
MPKSIKTGQNRCKTAQFRARIASIIERYTECREASPIIDQAARTSDADRQTIETTRFDAAMNGKHRGGGQL